MTNLRTEQINDHMYYIGVNDRKTHLFESMWPLPNGISYNSYLLKGEENILFDLVKVTEVTGYIEKIKEVIGDENLDYIVVDHAEPDHSSSIPEILSVYPNAKIVCNKKTVDFLKNFYDVQDNLVIVKDGETIEMSGRKYTFYTTPMVHWPESMVCFEEETGILFSQDIFGSFGTLDGGIFDDQIDFTEDYLDETRRYFINIVGKYAKQAIRALEKLGSTLDIKMICSDHGPIWRKDPAKIVEMYLSLAKQEVEEGLLIIYGSMYGNTEKMAEAVARGAARAGVKKIKITNASKTPFSYILSDAWKYKGIVIGSCSYDNDLFPPVKFIATEFKHQKMKNNVWGFFGSYSWSGGALKTLRQLGEDMKLNVLERQPEIKGAANDEEIEELMRLGEDMAKAILED